MNLSDKAIATIRTAVPAGTAVALTWFAAWVQSKFAVAVDVKPAIAAVSTAGVTVAVGVYYRVARAAVEKWPQLGWIFGVNAKIIGYDRPRRRR